MTERDRNVIFSLNGGGSEPGGLESFDDFADGDNRPADFSPGLVSLEFITAAVRRSVRFCVAMTLAGLLIGLGVYEATPQKYQATATVLLTLSPYETGQLVAQDNQAIAKTNSVAQLGEQSLGLQQSVSSFLNSYSVVPVTDRVLDVTATAASSSEASLRANAVATAFLKFRATQLQTEQNLEFQSLNQQISEAKRRLSAIGSQISQLSSQSATADQQSQLSALRAQQTSETSTLGSLQQGLSDAQTTNQPKVAAAVQGSQVLSVAPLPHSRIKPMITYGAIGLLAGLAVGLAIVIIRALMSDRLRQRDDIANALDAPVKLSVGLLPARRRVGRRDLDLRRVVASLQIATPAGAHRPVCLAVVAVDNAPDVAQAVAALAASSPAKVIRSSPPIFPGTVIWRVFSGSRTLAFTRPAAMGRPSPRHCPTAMISRPLVRCAQHPGQPDPSQPKARCRLHARPQTWCSAWSPSILRWAQIIWRRGPRLRS